MIQQGIPQIVTRGIRYSHDANGREVYRPNLDRHETMEYQQFHPPNSMAIIHLIDISCAMLSSSASLANTYTGRVAQLLNFVESDSVRINFLAFCPHVRSFASYHITSFKLIEALSINEGGYLNHDFGLDPQYLAVSDTRCFSTIPHPGSHFRCSDMVPYATGPEAAPLYRQPL